MADVTLGSVDGPLAGPLRRWIALAPPVLRFAVVASLVLAVFGPRGSRYVPGDATDGVAIVVVLDVSESMGEPGLGGVRKLDTALEEIVRFVLRRGNDRVGLVTFGLEAVERVPPTLDHSAFLGVATAVRPGELGDGTAVGTALGLAANRLRAVEAESRVIVLVSDGRSNAGALDPVTAARAAAALGQKVFVVEVEDDGAVPTHLDRVAIAGGGRHFPVTDRQGLDGAYREIDLLAPTTFRAAGHTVEDPMSSGLIWLALGLLFVERVLLASPLGRLS